VAPPTRRLIFTPSPAPRKARARLDAERSHDLFRVTLLVPAQVEE